MLFSLFTVVQILFTLKQRRLELICL